MLLSETIDYVSLMTDYWWWDFNFWSAGSITKVIFLSGSVSTNGTSINSNCGCSTNLIKFRKTILWHRCESAESQHFIVEHSEGFDLANVVYL